MNHGQASQSQGIHTLVAYTYADLSARTGATGFVSTDVGKLAFQIDNASYWLLSAVDPTWVKLSTGGYYPLVAGNQAAGSTYTLLGALPELDYSRLGSVCSLRTLVQIPASSTAQVRLYNVTDTEILYESGVVSGPQTNYDFGPAAITLPTGSAVIEFWMSTPTITGGNATCLSAGLIIDG